MGEALHGDAVTLRSPAKDDVGSLAEIRAKPEVFRWWRGGADLAAAVAEELADP